MRLIISVLVVFALGSVALGSQPRGWNRESSLSRSLPTGSTARSGRRHASYPPTLKILFIGDSITRALPTQEYEWFYAAGMAASAEEHDYVHRLARKIEDQTDVANVEIVIHNQGFGSVVGRLSTIDQFASPDIDLVVIQLGEHENEDDGEEYLRANYQALVTIVSSWSGNPLVLCTGVWDPNHDLHGAYRGWAKTVDDTMRDACTENGGFFASVEHVAVDPSNRGFGATQGVRWHPNDDGMEGYAAALFNWFQIAN